MTQSAEDLASRLFLAIQEDDQPAIEALYSDDLETWHSFDDTTKNRAESLALIRHFGPDVARRRYRLVESFGTLDRVVQRYELTITLIGRAEEHRINLVVFLSIEGNQVSWIDEYIDSRDVTLILSAVQAAGEGVDSGSHRDAAGLDPT